MKDQIGPAGEKLFGDASRPKVPRYDLDGGSYSGRRVGGEDIRQRELLNCAAVQRGVFHQPLGRFAADHPGRAGDEDMYDPVSIWASCPRLSRASTSLHPNFGKQGVDGRDKPRPDSGKPHTFETSSGARPNTSPSPTLPHHIPAT